MLLLCAFLPPSEILLGALSTQATSIKSSELGVLSPAVSLNLGSADTGAGCAVREEQKHDSDQNQDPVPNYS